MKLFRNFDAQLIENDSGCLIWKMARNELGYGILRYKGKNMYAHRFAWMRVNGEIPEDKMICHTCDTPACCNINHLFISDGFGNMRDMAAKGRAGGFAKNGDDNMNAKITLETARRIRDIGRIGNNSQTEIARYFNVCQMTISLVLRNRIWKEVA